MSRLLAGTALAVCMSVAANAAPIEGSSSIDLSGVTTDGNLANGVQINISGGTYEAPAAGDYLAADGTTIGAFSVTATVGSAVSFSGAFGSFTGQVVSRSITANAFANIIIQGTFTPTVNPPDANFAEVRLTVTQTQTSFSGGAVIDSERTVNVPEPMSMALFGLGLAGLGVAMRRKA
ncbi:PEP-CTERM sorting domain-containing protein [Falsiroseomonas bella]|nr:PEP-CTERM sorting domain-containing protein [Falsiroseomonas bella]